MVLKERYFCFSIAMDSGWILNNRPLWNVFDASRWHWHRRWTRPGRSLNEAPFSYRKWKNPPWKVVTVMSRSAFPFLRPILLPSYRIDAKSSTTPRRLIKITIRIETYNEEFRIIRLGKNSIDRLEIFFDERIPDYNCRKFYKIDPNDFVSVQGLNFAMHIYRVDGRTHMRRIIRSKGWRISGRTTSRRRRAAAIVALSSPNRQSPDNRFLLSFLNTSLSSLLNGWRMPDHFTLFPSFPSESVQGSELGPLFRRNPFLRLFLLSSIANPSFSFLLYFISFLTIDRTPYIFHKL